jgi:hypothetical protein
VEQFNCQHINLARGLPQVPTHNVDSDRFDNIKAFAEFVHEKYNTSNNPTLDLVQVDVLDLNLESQPDL